MGDDFRSAQPHRGNGQQSYTRKEERDKDDKNDITGGDYLPEMQVVSFEIQLTGNHFGAPPGKRPSSLLAVPMTTLILPREPVMLLFARIPT